MKVVEGFFTNSFELKINVFVRNLKTLNIRFYILEYQNEIHMAFSSVMIFSTSLGLEKTSRNCPLL